MQMSSLLFWLFLNSISVRGGRHYLLTEIEWRISQNNNDDICLPLCHLFLICWIRTSITVIWNPRSGSALRLKQHCFYCLLAGLFLHVVSIRAQSISWDGPFMHTTLDPDATHDVRSTYVKAKVYPSAGFRIRIRITY